MRNALIACLLITSSLIFANEDFIDLPEETLVALIEEGYSPIPDYCIPEESLEPLIDEEEELELDEEKPDPEPYTPCIECRQKCGLFTFAGDVRARWIAVSEAVDGDPKRGIVKAFAPDECIPYSRFRSEINLYMDYDADCTWVSSKLRWTNYNGVDSCTPTKVEMDRAFIGFDICGSDCSDFYVEVGRSNLGFMFESRVEFASFFDGAHLYFSRDFPNYFSFVAHGGPFIIDTLTNHYGWAAELFFQEILDTRWSLKYSIIDWRHHRKVLNHGNCEGAKKLFVNHHPRYDFLVSQMILGYQTEIDCLHCKTFYGYAAILNNHAARKTITTANRPLNWGGYVGFTLGRLNKARDYSFDLNYQAVQAQAIPEFDISGIGHGNVEDRLLSDCILEGCCCEEAFGFTNFHGVCGTFLYALTDTLSFRAIGQASWPLNRVVGENFQYRSFELSVIYAW